MNGEEQQVPMEAAQMDVVEQPDGSALIMEPEVTSQQDFYENLAATLDKKFLKDLATQLLEDIKLDREAREKRDKQYEEGIRRTGLGEDAPGGAQFEGASRVVHPALAEGCVDFSARAMKELFPSNGPVKTKIVGYLQDKEAMDRAERKCTFMNWQLTDQICEYRGELEQLLTQLPLGGSQFLKFWYDNDKRRVMCEFVPIDRIFLPYSASNFYTSPRVTEWLELSKFEVEKRVRSGLYLDIDIGTAPGTAPETSKTQQANEKVEGKTDTGFNEDGLRSMYEVYLWTETPGDSLSEGKMAPYIVTVDEWSQEILAYYRNWAVDDPQMEKQDWIVEFQFIPWRGAYAIGLPHLIGGLSAAATGALRALLDSAHINNFPGGMKLKGGRASGQTVTIAPTELVEVEAPAGVDDIRKVIAPFPFNQPSQVLFNLLEWVTQASKSVIATSTEMASQVGDRTPVGTTMALIEQGAITYSAIHARLHESQKKCLKILQRLNRDFLDEEQEVEELGKMIIRREEFRLTNDIIPVSDPTIFSEAQRYAQIQALMQMSQDPTVPWNRLKIYKRALKQMKIDGADELLPNPPEPVSADPITEITAAMQGMPVQAQQQMPHMQHIQEELAFLLDPVFGAANPTILNPGFATIMGDVQQHLVFAFAQFKQQAAAQAQQHVLQQLGAQATQMGLPQIQVPRFVQMQMQSPQMAQHVQMMYSQIWQQIQQQLAPLVQQMQQADQLVKSKMPPPTDPALQAQLQAVQMQEQTKMQLGQMKDALEKAKLGQEAQFEEQRIELEKFVRTQLEIHTAQLKAETEVAKNRDDNLQHQQTEVQKNREDNETNLYMTEMRERAAQERAIITKQMDIEAAAAQKEDDLAATQMTGEQDLLKQVVTESMKQIIEREKLDADMTKHDDQMALAERQRKDAAKAQTVAAAAKQKPEKKE